MTYNLIKISGKHMLYALFTILVLCFVGCKDSEDDSEVDTFDPSKPVLVSDFIPKSGGANQRLVIYGSNFGNDPSKIHVYIGGKQAITIGVKSESLYCLVPEKAYSGKIEVIIDNGDQSVIAEAESIFNYQKTMVVSTLCGYRNERDDQGWHDGKFSECTGFGSDAVMMFDPKNSKHLYVVYDNSDYVKLINFEDSTVTTAFTRGMGQWNRMRSIDFTLDGEYMLIANDAGDHDAAVSILSRANGFKDPQRLTENKQCNGASIHPITGEMYFNSFEKGQFYRFDMNKFYSGSWNVKDYQELFKIQDNGWEFKIVMHPSGNYAYIVVINQHYILRTDYNWAEKKFNQPYVICGTARQSGWVDGVGTSVRLARPYQGVFVKNPDYKGKADEYDFYFVEKDNHDIRKLTPEGKVTTFAGRGSESLNGDKWGFVEGDLRKDARFRDPTGIAYNEEEKAFYINDNTNRRIRKIALEK
ncbi:MAG: IPT/TIG domain-containing protein [Bacteroides sp.]|jgi:DNA-binding beta-propeller fold protein YncE|nr:IPT/TIG domain-containing protein [Bacteroides sp.]